MAPKSSKLKSLMETIPVNGGHLSSKERMIHPLPTSTAQIEENRKRLVPLLCSATISFSKADLLKKLEDQGVPAGPIDTLEEAFNKPQFEHREMWVDLDVVPGIRTPISFSRSRPNLTMPSHKLGES